MQALGGILPDGSSQIFLCKGSLIAKYSKVLDCSLKMFLDSMPVSIFLRNSTNPVNIWNMPNYFNQKLCRLDELTKNSCILFQSSYYTSFLTSTIKKAVLSEDKRFISFKTQNSFYYIEILDC